MMSVRLPGFVGVRLRRFGVAALAPLAVVLGALAFASAPAQALIVHKYLSTPHITEVTGGATAGPLTEVHSMSVDEGRLWAAEHIAGTLNRRTDAFNDSTGASELQLAETPSAAAVAAGQTTPISVAGCAKKAVKTKAKKKAKRKTKKGGKR